MNYVTEFDLYTDILLIIYIYIYIFCAKIFFKV